MGKVYCFIDGFNLYHSLTKPEFHKYKWLDVRKLAEQFIGSKDTLEKVFYFSARCPWDKAKRERHIVYTNALSKTGTILKLGNFKEVTRTLNKNVSKLYTSPLKRWFLNLVLPEKLKYKAYEEKQTDVNIGVSMVHYAHLNACDSMLLISADSDLKDAVQLVIKELGKPVRILFPPREKMSKKKHSNKAMKEACNGNFDYILEEHFRSAQLPEKIQIDANAWVERPESWN